MKKNQGSIYRRLLHYAGKYWPAFVFGVLGTALASGIDASFAWLIKPLLDKGFIARDTHFIHWLPLGLILIFLLRNSASVMATYGMAWTGRSVVAQFRQDLFAHYVHLPAHYLDSTTAGQLLAKLIYNTEQVAKASTDAIVTLVRETCFITGLLIVMFINSWQLSLSFLIAAPLVGIISRFASRRLRHISQSIQHSMSGITQLTEEGLEGYRVIRTFGAEDYEIKRFNAMVSTNRQREMKTITTNALSTAAVQLVAAVLIAGTVYLATAKIAAISAGTFVSIITAMLAMLKPMRNLTNVNNVIQKGIAGAESLFNVLDEPLEPDSGTKIISKARGAVDFVNVNFSYRTTQKTALSDINLSALPGQTIALVGRSGSGKSTLVSLLLRLYEEYSGAILLDGQNIQQLRLANLRQQFALVSQQVVLFNDTIANNIAYGQTNISEAAIIAAATAAHAMEFIVQLPQGLATLIGDNGILLSGGQRQRLAIARALLKDAPILLLDEATSALDTESEQTIQTALSTLMQNRTTFVIAHRLSTIEKAEQIIVMDHGRIVEAGNHATLLAAKGYYARLHQRQFQE